MPVDVFAGEEGDRWSAPDDYPTQAELDHLANVEQPREALDVAKHLWNQTYGQASEGLRDAERPLIACSQIVMREGRFLRLATGGWSGNEAILSALGKNHMTWLLTWRLSSSGGIHIFEYPTDVARR